MLPLPAFRCQAIRGMLSRSLINHKLDYIPGNDVLWVATRVISTLKNIIEFNVNQ
jgi:hypothetical protein